MAAWKGLTDDAGLKMEGWGQEPGYAGGLHLLQRIMNKLFARSSAKKGTLTH